METDTNEPAEPIDIKRLAPTGLPPAPAHAAALAAARRDEALASLATTAGRVLAAYEEVGAATVGVLAWKALARILAIPVPPEAAEYAREVLATIPRATFDNDGAIVDLTEDK